MTTPGSGGRADTITFCLLTAAVIIYAYWLSDGTFRLVAPPSGGPVHSLLFNSMLEHLIRGRFDVDPAVAGSEAFTRDGRVYADWGVVPALVRIPLLLFRGGLQLDVTRLSALLAVSIAATMKILTLRVAFRGAPAGPGAAILYWALALALLFGGAQIEFLKASVYQETCLWAGALGACFVFLALRGLVTGRFSVRSLCAMAAIAGTAMLTRATVGVGLSVATVFLLLVNQEAPSGAAGSYSKRAVVFAREWVSSRSAVLPALVLLLFAVLVEFMNFERWGNPLVFADYDRYLYYMQRFPDRLVRLHQYGVFNPERIPFGVIYYFLPIWVLQRAYGQQLFYEHETRLFDAIELPPSTFLLTDLLLVGLLAFAFASVVTKRDLPIKRAPAIAIALGLSVSWFFILSFGVLAFRYRIDFHPLLEFGAFVGAVLMLRIPAPTRSFVKGALVGASAIGILASNAELILYRASDFGSFVDYKPGVINFYRYSLGSHFGRPR